MRSVPDQFFVRVTAEDIARGKPNDPEECPVTLAVRRALGQDEGLVSRITRFVLRRPRLTIRTGGFICISEETGDVLSRRQDVWRIPHEAGNFIDRFDEGREVYPIRFLARRAS